MTKIPPTPPTGTDENAVCLFVIEKAKEIFGDPTVIFFGSRAGGPPRSNSDFDFAIDAPKANHSQWVLFRDVVRKQAPTLLPIDLVNLSEQLETSLRIAIHDKGKILLRKGDLPSKNK